MIPGWVLYLFSSPSHAVSQFWCAASQEWQGVGVVQLQTCTIGHGACADLSARQGSSKWD